MRIVFISPPEAWSMVENTDHIRQANSPSGWEFCSRGIFGSLSRHLMKVVPPVHTGQAPLWSHNGKKRSIKWLPRGFFRNSEVFFQAFPTWWNFPKSGPQKSHVRSGIPGHEIHHHYIITYHTVSSVKAETVFLCTRFTKAYKAPAQGKNSISSKRQ